MTQNQKGSLQLLLAALLWSTSGLILKTSAVSVSWVLFIRSLSAGLVLFPFFKKDGYFTRPMVVTGVLYALFVYAFSITTRLSSSALAVAMQYASPLYAVFFTSLQNKRFNPQKIPVVLLFGLGVFLSISGFLTTTPWPVLLVSLSIGILFLLYSAGLKYNYDKSPLAVVAGVNWVCTLLFGTMLLWDASPAPASPKDVLVLAAFGVLVAALSYAIYGIGIRKVHIEQAFIILLAEPVLNPLWVFLATGEKPGGAALAGLLLILLGGFLNIRILRQEL